MAIWQDSNGGLHDDMDGAALSFPSWPQGMTLLTDAQVAAIRAPTLAQAQASQIALIQSAYQSAISQPVSYVSVGKVNQVYQADSVAIANIQSTLAGCASTGATPSGFYWVAKDNTQVPFTYADLQGLASVIFAQAAPLFQKYQTYKAAINAATTVSAVQAVTWGS